MCCIINLFSDSHCEVYLGGPHGTIKSQNFPFAYPDYAQCVWYIILEKFMEITFQFLEFDLPRKNETDLNYVEIATVGGYKYTFYSKGRRGLPFSLVSSDKMFRVHFKTGRNNIGNRGFLLKYLTYEYPKISIAMNRKTKATILNENGMFV